jgi:hypothetical protein
MMGGIAMPGLINDSKRSISFCPSYKMIPISIILSCRGCPPWFLYLLLHIYFAQLILILVKSKLPTLFILCFSLNCFFEVGYFLIQKGRYLFDQRIMMSLGLNLRYRTNAP